MTSGGKEEVQLLIDKLKESSAGGQFPDPDVARDVVVDLSELLAGDVEAVEYGKNLGHQLVTFLY